MLYDHDPLHTVRCMYVIVRLLRFVGCRRLSFVIVYGLLISLSGWIRPRTFVCRRPLIVHRSFVVFRRSYGACRRLYEVCRSSFAAVRRLSSVVVRHRLWYTLC